MLLVGKLNKWKFAKYILRRAEIEQNIKRQKGATLYLIEKIAHPYMALVSENLLMFLKGHHFSVYYLRGETFWLELIYSGMREWSGPSGLIS